MTTSIKVVPKEYSDLGEPSHSPTSPGSDEKMDFGFISAGSLRYIQRDKSSK